LICFTTTNITLQTIIIVTPTQTLPFKGEGILRFSDWLLDSNNELFLLLSIITLYVTSRGYENLAGDGEQEKTKGGATDSA